MSKKQNQYFDNKHPWSVTKDEILRRYLYPYFLKVYPFSWNGIVYVDGFAGEGIFGDGQKGSPIVAIDQYKSASKGKRKKIQIQFVFGEKDASRRSELEENIATRVGSVGYINKPLLCDSYHEAIEKACSFQFSDKKPSTYFYYLDPFGIKGLNLDLLCRTPNPAHSEVLLNFNSIGFLRAACCATNAAHTLIPDDADDEGMSDLYASESGMEAWLSEAFGGEGWKLVVDEFTNGEMDFWRAEQKISDMYCENIRRNYYRYVTCMPVKDMHSSKPSGSLKYRMIHMTNSSDGCIVMNDNMLKINQEMQMMQTSLFSIDIDSHLLDSDMIANEMCNAVKSFSIGDEFNMGDAAAFVVSRCGVSMKVHDLLKNYLAPLIDIGVIDRIEKKTPTGRIKTSFASKDRIVRLA
ncbi:three-Cys-motif partner protein TcmP [Lancefieldella parvula]|uniref:three-Cys-motif partner protein TcmP n=1 Tax=Lancefieldella parvula TaxID=1382 RepID=UPI0028EB4BC7|nr:three-Cys-motif partner protein TcmP [Lancefieldella parvula]